MHKLALKSFYMLEIWFPWSGSPRGNRWVTNDLSEIVSAIEAYLQEPQTPLMLCESYEGAKYQYSVVLEAYSQGVCLDRRDLRQYIKLAVPGFSEITFDENGYAPGFNMKKEMDAYYKADHVERQQMLFGKLHRWSQGNEENLPLVIFPASEREAIVGSSRMDGQDEDAMRIAFDWQSWRSLPIFELERPFLQESERVGVIMSDDGKGMACLVDEENEYRFDKLYVYGEEFLD